MSNRKNPSTSNDAYRSLDAATLNERYKLILDALGKVGEGTTEEIAAIAKVPHEQIWKRFSELSNMGLIFRPGNKRLMKSGRNGFTWMLTNGATPKTTTTERALKREGSIPEIAEKIKNVKIKQPELF